MFFFNEFHELNELCGGMDSSNSKNSLKTFIILEVLFYKCIILYSLFDDWI